MVTRTRQLFPQPTVMQNRNRDCVCTRCSSKRPFKTVFGNQIFSQKNSYTIVKKVEIIIIFMRIKLNIIFIGFNIMSK